jgi:hypothetical protein
MPADPEPATTSESDAGAIAKKLHWPAMPSNVSAGEQARVEGSVRRIMDASETSAKRIQQGELFQLYMGLYSEIQASIVKSAEKRRQSRTWGRGLVAVTSLAAALAGLALALNYHGFGSRAFGIAAAVAGTWSTISTSLRLDEDYQRNARRNHSYKRLAREVQLYLVSTFPTAPAEQAASRFVKFVREYDDIQPGGEGQTPDERR